MSRARLLGLCAGTEALIILSIAAACRLSGLLFYPPYHLIYGLGLSLLLPLYLLRREGQDISAAGVRAMGRRQWLTAVLFAALSVGGQVIPPLAADKAMAWERLPVAVLPLCMTTFFEEFWFRGFLQPRLAARFGRVAAAVLSGALFALYHLGYPGFRTVEDLLLLWAVGIGFAAVFWLSGQNLWAACLVNLPNAFVSYVQKTSQFPRMTPISSLFAVLTLAAAAGLLWRTWKGGVPHGRSYADDATVL